MGAGRDLGKDLPYCLALVSRGHVGQWAGARAAPKKGHFPCLRGGAAHLGLQAKPTTTSLGHLSPRIVPQGPCPECGWLLGLHSGPGGFLAELSLNLAPDPPCPDSSSVTQGSSPAWEAQGPSGHCWHALWH